MSATSIQRSLIVLHVFFEALNLIGPRAMDVLSELSYTPMTPDHFPSMFCKVSDSAAVLPLVAV